MNEGYFSIQRKLLGSDLWLSERFTKGQAWVDLVGRANHSRSKILIGLKTIIVERGQLVTSQVKLAERWRWDRKTVNRFLMSMEKEQMIHSKTDRDIQYGNTVITIINYNKYQSGIVKEDSERDSERDSKRDSKRDTNNNVKNNVKNNNIYIPENSSNDLGEEVDKVSEETISIKNLKLYMSKSYPTRESYINDIILNHLVGLYNKAEKTPYNKSTWLRDVELIELFPLGLEVGIKTEDLQKFANSLYEKYSSGYTLKDKRKIKNFKQFFCGIVRRDQIKFRKQFGEILTWNIPY